MLNVIITEKKPSTAKILLWGQDIDQNIRGLHKKIEADMENEMDTWVMVHPDKVFDLYVYLNKEGIQEGIVFVENMGADPGYIQEIENILKEASSFASHGYFMFLNQSSPLLVSSKLLESNDTFIMSQMLKHRKKHIEMGGCMKAMYIGLDNLTTQTFSGLKTIRELHLYCSDEEGLEMLGEMAATFMLSTTVVEKCIVSMSSKLMDKETEKDFNLSFLLSVMRERYIDSLINQRAENEGYAPAYWVWSKSCQKHLAKRFYITEME